MVTLPISGMVRWVALSAAWSRPRDGLPDTSAARASRAPSPAYTPGFTPAVESRSGLVRSVFTPAYDTTQRYAAADWAKNLRTLPRSVTLKRISSPLLFNLLITVAVCAFHASPLAALSSLSLNRLPHTLAGNALGLLLVFRTNAAYDRFWEARKVWGVITSECRALASNAVTFMTPQQALPFLSLVAAFPVATKAYLRGTSEKSDMRRLRALLQQEEYDALIPIVNKPQYILTRQRQLAWQSSVAGVNEKEREILLKSVSVLGECVSTCERIFNVSATLQLESNG